MNEGRHRQTRGFKYLSRNLGDKYYTDENLIYSDEGISRYSTTLLERPAMKQLLRDTKFGMFNVLLIKEVTRNRKG